VGPFWEVVAEAGLDASQRIKEAAEQLGFGEIMLRNWGWHQGKSEFIGIRQATVDCLR